MIYYLLGSTLAALGFGGLSYFLIRELTGAKKEIGELEKIKHSLILAIKERDHVIQRIQEVNDEADRKKKKLKTGSPADRFDASLDILGSSLRDKTGPDKPPDYPPYMAPVPGPDGDGKPPPDWDKVSTWGGGASLPVKR